MSVRTVSEPALARLPDLLYQALHEGTMVAVFCTCTVEKHGRITGTGAVGDRLLLFKPTGAISVQHLDRTQAVARQPAGSALDITTCEEGLRVYAYSDSGRETLEVEVRTIHAVTQYAASVTAPFDQTDTEKDLQAYVDANPTVIEPGLRIVEREKPTATGRMDFFATDSDGCTVIIECKHRKANTQHVDQLFRYVTDYRRSDSSTVRGILVAPEIGPTAERTLHNHALEFVAVTEYSRERRHWAESTLDEFE